ncbi:hypothetical protein SAMN02745166_00084 [Prosthecobacter debontii]|uniref:Uncharacterized protein n=1 Tax=Prosthecobacter debontii TaxID=48467 RepID=A0A1T4WF30_9BACT|nr:hypothetical protein SAMN02745166_00084 [Prosthecobacter debontii]
MLAYLPTPRVHCEWTASAHGVGWGVWETDRVVMLEFGHRIAPGRQVILFVGPKSLVMPCSLDSLLSGSVLVSLLIAVAIGYWVRFAKR